ARTPATGSRTSAAETGPGGPRGGTNTDDGGSRMSEDPSRAGVAAALMPAAWPAPPGVHAFTTLRHGAGGSIAPFDSFNLGARNGDDALVVASNRAQLCRLGALPASPHWLRQVHGTEVLRLDQPLRAP